MNRIFRNVKAYVFGYIFTFLTFFKKNIKIGKKFRLFKNSEIRIYRNCNCIIGNNAKIDYNTVISVLKNGTINIGNGVGIGSNSMIVCHDEIKIGDGTMIGPNTYIYDHDHLYSNGIIKKGEYKTKKVSIGKNCWIGAGCIILKGTIIGDNCIVGAGTLLKGIYPDDSIITNTKETVVKKINKEE